MHLLAYLNQSLIPITYLDAATSGVKVERPRMTTTRQPPVRGEELYGFKKESRVLRIPIKYLWTSWIKTKGPQRDEPASDGSFTV
jgi:hypothetical protein